MKTNRFGHEFMLIHLWWNCKISLILNFLLYKIELIITLSVLSMSTVYEYEALHLCRVTLFSSLVLKIWFMKSCKSKDISLIIPIALSSNPGLKVNRYLNNCDLRGSESDLFPASIPSTSCYCALILSE